MAVDQSEVERRTKETVERYIELTQTWDNEAALEMWAPDGVLRDPEPVGEFNGRLELEAHYRSRPAERPFDFEVTALHVDGHDAILEVKGHDRRPDVLGADFEFADLFTVNDDGTIARIIGYHR
jgi:limonene-1,2-epoxide hydrolase